MSYTNAAVWPEVTLHHIGITKPALHYQERPNQLIEATLARKEGSLANSGALVIKTGQFTGRSPQDKYIVKDEVTANTVDWGNFNNPVSEEVFLQLREKMTTYLNGQPEIWVRDAQACASPEYRLNIRVVNEQPSANLFAYNMFIRPDAEALTDFEPDWYVIQAPGFKADPATDGTRQSNFAIVSFTHKAILIGGTGYTGEMKKGIFTVLNYLLAQEKGVLPMHCSANIGEQGDTAIFFGLSGTGKTTLSADPTRRLIGDDEHGWSANEVFNFEGGCYAKVIDLSPEKEPDIYKAIRPGALLENTTFIGDTNLIDFGSKKLTENTRVSYPLHFIQNAVEPSVGDAPTNIFFLSADAYGILPPVSRLTIPQAMYYFLSGYTARVAGTEAGVVEPKATFSSCFGAPFLPLHPGKYAAMLGEKLAYSHVNVWMINTGWIGGAYGTGRRISLSHTRAIINAILNGELEGAEYETHPIFGLRMPKACTNVPENILNPCNTWSLKTDYEASARKLARLFAANFTKFAAEVSSETAAAGPTT